MRVSAGDPPSGVVTFLFTDIEGSTRRWEADAEAMRAALSKHDQVLQTAIESQDGFLFSHTGDGVVAAFASPRSAVDAAVKAQLALELPVRMGIATGEAELPRRLRRTAAGRAPPNACRRVLSIRTARRDAGCCGAGTRPASSWVRQRTDPGTHQRRPAT